MRRGSRAFIVVAFVMALVLLARRAFFFAFDTHEEPAVARHDPDFEAHVAMRANALVDRYAAKSRFSGVVAVRFGDRVRVMRGVGDITDPDTRFTCGSLPKQMTGYAIHRLAQRGALSLEDRLDVHLPELRGAPAGEPTVDQVLRMTSGLPGSVDPLTNIELQRHRDA